MKTLRYFLFIILSLSILIFLACGGGGGDGASSGTSSSSSADTGSVAVFLADGPADDYDHIWITVNEVTLIPSEGEHVVIYQSSNGHKLDILAYRDEDFLFTMKRKIPAGTYNKIRLGVSKIEPEGGTGPCSYMTLPSKKIDLNPRRTFEVEPDETLAIRLDIDANKSINISGSCKFRPVVFVEIEPIAWRTRCPGILKGVITTLIDKNEDGVIEGFVLDLPGDRGTLDVYLLENAVIFGEDGLPAGSDDLAAGQTVWVRGRLDVDGNLQASEVVIGPVDVLKGTVETAYENMTFSLKTGENDLYTVDLSEETLVLVGCDDAVLPGAIQPGMLARVFGKLSGDEIQAIVVFLKPAEISGEVVSLEPYNDGYNLTIKIDGGEEVTVFLPEDTGTYLEGDGKVEEEEMDLLCEGRQVRVVLDPEKGLTAKKVIVEADQLEGWVNDIDEFAPRSLSVNDGLTVVDVQVREGATILDLRGGIKPAEFDDIEKQDVLRCLGLYDCTDTDYHAFVVLIVGTVVP